MSKRLDQLVGLLEKFEQMQYNPQEVEKLVNRLWLEEESFNVYSSNLENNQPSYSIVLPPPNVTGYLHMGHAFQLTLMDILIRLFKMRGKKVLWQGGFDHAGIATQLVVEQQLVQKGLSRYQFTREEFTERVKKWSNKSSNTILEQQRRMGVSLDWSHMRFTLDEKFSQAVRKAFITLFKDGLIYRGERLINWDPKIKTAISDLEVTYHQKEGRLYYISYPLVEDVIKLTAATTRPETIFGDVALAVHPSDQRYQRFINKEVKLPLTSRTIPIIADELVEISFGSGCVKITPAHDFKDYEIAKRHNLSALNIFDEAGALNENTPIKYQRLDRFKAREMVINDLKEQGLLVKDEQHTLNIAHGERSGVIIEPKLTKQWFIKMDDLAKEAILKVKERKIRFVPHNWEQIYFQWLENIKDWCISRQLWWGHRIPAWYDNLGNCYVANSEKEARHQFNLKGELIQDQDVLDTWFSSALWPFAALDWPKHTSRFKTFFPTTVLVTGFDIIFFWVARMIMFSLYFTKQIPFAEVYITGLIRDRYGQKMSKSKGNVIDPIDLIEGIDLQKLIDKRLFGLINPKLTEEIIRTTKKEFPKGIQSYGGDALRLTFASLASGSREINFDVTHLTGNRNFCNKLWNAIRYVIITSIGEKFTQKPDYKSLNLADQWILSLTQKTVLSVEQNFRDYKFDTVVKILYQFVWDDFCAWYLEANKIILTTDNDQHRYSAKYTILKVSKIILRLLHPFIPHLTEFLWQKIVSFDNSIKISAIINESYPQSEVKLINANSEEIFNKIKTIVLAIRSQRGVLNIAPHKSTKLVIESLSEEFGDLIEKNRFLIMKLAKIEEIIPAPNFPLQAIPISLPEGNFLIPLEGIIDINKEKIAIAKRIDILEKELIKFKTKIKNPKFLTQAPQKIITNYHDLISKKNLKLEYLKRVLTYLE